MKNLTSRFPTLFGITLLAAVMVFSLASCQQEPAPNNNDAGPVIPSALQNTEWTHTSGDKISFDKDSVTITPKNGSPQKFPLKDTSSVNQGGIDQTILYFKDNQSPDNTITYQNGGITMVNFSIIDTLNKTNGWSEGSGSGDNGNDPNATPAEDFRFEYYPTGGNPKYCIIAYYRGNGGNVIIPSIVNGIPVNGIEAATSEDTGVFYNKNLTSIVIPAHFKISGYTIRNNNNLTSITIGANALYNMDIPLENLNGLSFGVGIDLNFPYHYKLNGQAAGTYTRTIGSDVWTKSN